MTPHIVNVTVSGTGNNTNIRQSQLLSCILLGRQVGQDSIASSLITGGEKLWGFPVLTVVSASKCVVESSPLQRLGFHCGDGEERNVLFIKVACVSISQNHNSKCVSKLVVGRKREA